MKILYETDSTQIQQFGGMIHIIEAGKVVIALTIQEFKAIAGKIETLNEEVEK